MVNLESVCDKVEKDNELGIWDENQDYGKILYFSSSRILVKKMGKRWSHRKTGVALQYAFRDKPCVDRNSYALL